MEGTMRGVVLVVALAAGLSAAPAASETGRVERDARDCNQPDILPPDQVLAACSRLLADPEVEFGLKPNQVAALYFNRAFAHYRLKDHDRALLNLRFSIALDPSRHTAYLLRGNVMADRGDHAAAIADYTKCLGLRPRDFLCNHNRASSLGRLGKYAAALRDMTVAIQINPRNSGAYAGRAGFHEKLGNRQAAIRDYRMALQLGATDIYLSQRLAVLEGRPPAAPAAGFEALRAACFRAPPDEDGIAACTRAIAASDAATPRDKARVLNGRSWKRFKLGQFQLALADANRAIEIYPIYDSVYDTRGHIYAALGRREDAIRDFRKAIALTFFPRTRRSSEEGLRKLGVSP
jgi:tetratricopeptide (TPR) repeat protein